MLPLKRQKQNVMTKIERYRKKLQSEIAYCVMCQPFESGSYIWILGDEIELTVLLQELDIPEEVWDEVLEGIVCQNCGHSVELSDTVGTKPEEEQELEELYDRLKRVLSPKLDEFQSHLEKWPYLGLKHPIGKKILKQIMDFPIMTIRNGVWYRARSPKSGCNMNVAELLPPDPAKDVIPEGRYNHFGQQVFYLAASAEAAALETSIDGQAGIAWTLGFRIKLAERILDLEPEAGFPDTSLGLLPFGLTYGGHLDLKVMRDKGWKPEYFVPRFIADCARMSGLNGIKFKGTRSWHSNLVLFSWNDSSVEAIGEPRILQVNIDKDTEF